ncbi:hypothetical protein HBI23_117660 [Parastagonospora nodorum]|nr:hypothetical protein HBI28_149570 [Parastagonospora nodorum]KAH5494147.1 hypothetical protein HBI29_188480 [Parastagonospora nodorum]KAH5623763.1 hypothetical protein HBI22_170970 [Parastagonospora nodorum]KAH5661060.1 hypothetical protein HBI23_117660 [Parastagonospora nodorum]KAH5690212.1 hypothetical protein HBI44_174880 [Parastagonospora nodorum]
MTVSTAYAFFEALGEAGITHCFVNLGSDHPAMMEAMAKAVREKTNRFPRVITCPHEMVALSMADGYARVTNKPQCVIVHVDVGTQNLGAAVHNASVGRAPVLIFAGLSPYTTHGEYRGSRTEYIHWLQDVHDQKAIVAQYCRYTAEIKRGANVKEMVNRALSFAQSDPKGPVYVYGSREALEEDIKSYELNQTFWTPVQPAALDSEQCQYIAGLLVNAAQPLVVTGYSGRNHSAVEGLVTLANKIRGLRVLETGGCDMCFPSDHPGAQGLHMSGHPCIESADLILVIDCDVPWVPTAYQPSASATIIHLDSDPLKVQMPVFYINAVARYRVDVAIALRQINETIGMSTTWVDQLRSSIYKERWENLEKEQQERWSIAMTKAAVEPNGSYNTAFLARVLKDSCPAKTTWVVEAVTNAMTVHEQVAPKRPGSWINCGGGGLGWSGGGALGVKLALEYTEANSKQASFVCQIVGDGTYMFSVPGSVYWIAQRYSIPVLTIVLNNKGWNAPRHSMLLVHPEGEGTAATNEELNISFATTPDYAGIAKAASGGKCFTGIANTAEDLHRLLPEAIAAVQSGRVAVIDARIGGSEGKYQPEDI